MLIFIFLAVATFLTSALSAVLGMAGGILLMGLLSLVLSVPAAMVFHGVIQFVANGYRSWLLRSHIHVQGLVWYLIGSLIGFLPLLAISFTPSHFSVYLTLGLLPFVRYLPWNGGLFDFTRPLSAVLCGASVTFVQVAAGVGGPLLDVFFIKTNLNKKQIISTKAITQSLGHLIKVFYYFPLFKSALSQESSTSLVMLALPMCIILSFAGTKAGARIMETVSEINFHKATAVVIQSIGLFYLYKAFLLGI